MSEEESMQLLYYVLFGLMVGSYLLHDAGRKWPETVRNALVWFGIFMMVLVGYNNKDNIESQLYGGAVQSIGDGEITLTRSFDGHFYAEVMINGTALEFIVDTGASQVVISREDAQRAGLEPDKLSFFGRANTANGEVKTAPLRLEEVRLGDFIDSGVKASVNGGALETSLLGMSYLSRFESIEIRGDKMRLVR